MASEAAATQYACFAVMRSKGKDSMRTCSSDRGLLCPIALIPATDLRTIVAPESVYGVAGADRCEPPARPSAPRIAPPATLTTLARKAHPRKLARLLVSVAFIAILLVGPEAFSLSPQINTLSPNSGITSTSVTIAGTNFGSSQGSSTVTFNGGSLQILFGVHLASP